MIINILKGIVELKALKMNREYECIHEFRVFFLNITENYLKINY